MTAVWVATGPCYGHGGRFSFDPDTVITISVDPLTGRPPDVDEDVNPVEPTPEALARSVKQPMCPACCKIVNSMWRKAGRTSGFLDETDSLDRLRAEAGP